MNVAFTKWRAVHGRHGAASAGTAAAGDDARCRSVPNVREYPRHVKQRRAERSDGSGVAQFVRHTRRRGSGLEHRRGAAVPDDGQRSVRDLPGINVSGVPDTGDTVHTNLCGEELKAAQDIFGAWPMAMAARGAAARIVTVTAAVGTISDVSPRSGVRFDADVRRCRADIASRMISIRHFASARLA